METGIIALIIGSATALCGLMCKLTYSSKCTKVKCGSIEIERDTIHEQPINLSSNNLNLNAQQKPIVI
jgi:hypothetical protein